MEKNSKMVTDPISYDYNYPVMGGYNKRLNQYGKFEFVYKDLEWRIKRNKIIIEIKTKSIIKIINSIRW